MRWILVGVVVAACGDDQATHAIPPGEAAGPLGGDACGALCCGATGPCPQ